MLAEVKILAKEVILAMYPWQAFLTNIYWLFYLIPGYTFFRYLKEKNIYHKDTTIVESFVYSFFYSSLALLPLTVLAYFLVVPIWALAIIFLITLSFSFFYIYKHKYIEMNKEVLISLPRKVRTYVNDKNNYIPLFFISLLGFYFIAMQVIKAPSLLEFDAWYHISKINFSVGHGLSVFDPYFLINGQNAISSNYSANLLHSIFALPVYLLKPFGLTSFLAWAYSVSVFQLFAFGATFLLIKRLVGNKTLASTIFGIYFFINFMTLNVGLSEYPTRMAFYFFIIGLLFLIDLIDLGNTRLFKQPIYYLFVLSVIAVSLFHPVQSSLFILFGGGFIGLMFLLRKINFISAILLGLPLLLGIFTGLYTMVNSKFMPTEVYKIGDVNLFEISKSLKMVSWPGDSLTAFSFAITIGIIASLYFIKDKTAKTLLLYSAIFNNVLLYTPVFGLVNKLVPTFGIVRHDYYVTIINYTFIILPFFIGLVYVTKNTKIENNSIVLTLIAVAIYIVGPSQKEFKLFYDVSVWNQGSALIVNQLESFKQYIKPNSIVLANKSVSFSVPGIYDAYVQGLDNTRTTDSIDTTQSSKDLQKFIMDEKTTVKEKKEILNKYGVSYVILDAGDMNTQPEVNEIGLKELSKNSSFILYEVKK